MHKNKYIGISVLMVVLGAILAGVAKNDTQALKATQTKDMVMTTASQTDTGKVRTTAGVSSIFSGDFSENTEAYAQITAQAEQNTKIRTVLEEENEHEENTSSDVQEMSYEDEYSNLAIANVDHYVNVRTQPNTESEIVGKMYDDSVAQILETVGEGDDQWFQVISGNVEGYIKAQYFIYGQDAAAVIDSYVVRYAVVKANRLNVRQEPTTQAKRIGYIDFGESVKILEVGEEWLKVLYTEEKEGYVSAEYVTIEEQFVYAKSIAEEQAELAEQALLAARNTESDAITPENTTVREVIPPTDYSNVSELRSAIINYAMQFLGNRYIHGGQSLASGTDCSGFTSYSYAAFGYSLSRTPQGQWTSNGRSISVAEIQPGDIVCYSSNGGRCTHVALYIGNGQVLHSLNPKKGVVITDMYYDNTFLGVKNILD